MEISKVTSDHWMLLPPEVCRLLGLDKGGFVRFDIREQQVVLSNPGAALEAAIESLTLPEQTLAVEWLSKEDEEAFKNW